MNRFWTILWFWISLTFFGWTKDVFKEDRSSIPTKCYLSLALAQGMEFELLDVASHSLLARVS